MKICRTILPAAVVFAALAAGVVSLGTRDSLIGPRVAHSQNLGQRVVSGAVLADDSEPVVGATVFLKNQKTKAIRKLKPGKLVIAIVIGRGRFAAELAAVTVACWIAGGGALWGVMAFTAAPIPH